MKVRLIRSHRWQHDQLMAEARPPTTFDWAAPGEAPDISIYIVPPWPDPDAPEPLRTLRRTDIGRLYLFSQQDDGLFWAPGVFTSASTDSPPLVTGGFYIHPDQFIPGRPGTRIDECRAQAPDLLWSFVGTQRTAPGVRGALLALTDERAVLRNAETPWEPLAERQRLQAEYVNVLVRSQFVACPRGFSPVTHRLFETMRAGRVPVILSDSWRPPPLVDWDAFSIRIPEADARHLPSILREREQEAPELGRRAREVWEARFSPRGTVHQLVESCLLLHEHRPRGSHRVALAVKAVPTVAMRRRIRAKLNALVGRSDWWPLTSGRRQRPGAASSLLRRVRPTELARSAAGHLPAPLYRVVRSLRVKQAVRGYPESVITRSYGHGVQLRVSLQDPLAEGWYGPETQPPYPEMTAAREHGLSEGAVVFDIGAHQAVIALVLADIVGPQGRVVAVEGDRHNVKVARRNVELNGAQNLAVVEAACAAQTGSVTFHEGLNGRIDSGRLGNHRVRAVTVDELADEYGRPDVVYLDIEGYELAALSGAQRTLRQGATFVVEVHAGHELQEAGGSVAELVAVFRAHGYGFQSLRDVDWPHTPMRAIEAGDLPDNERFFLLAFRG